jgi:hypothetical protein
MGRPPDPLDRGKSNRYATRATLTQPKENTMNAGKIMRELKLLDQLEERVKKTVAPDPKILQQISRRREEILGSKDK